MAQEQLNKIEETSCKNHLELSRDEFRSALRTNASVLFLGQKYQTDFYGEEYFLQAASKVLECLKGAAVPNYTELWKKLTRVVEMPEGGEEFCSLPRISLTIGTPLRMRRGRHCSGTLRKHGARQPDALWRLAPRSHQRTGIPCTYGAWQPFFSPENRDLYRCFPSPDVPYQFAFAAAAVCTRPQSTPEL